MQQMQHAIDDGVDECAAMVLEVVPLIMRRIRSYMREARANDLSVPQFRALTFLNTHPGATLSDVAEHVGLTLPAASRMIDGLVLREYAERQPSTTNRRCIELRVSAHGQKILQVTRQHTQNALAKALETLSAPGRETTVRALEELRLVFSPDPESSTHPLNGVGEGR